MILNGAVAMDARGVGLEVAHVKVRADKNHRQRGRRRQRTFLLVRGHQLQRCCGKFWTKRISRKFA